MVSDKPVQSHWFSPQTLKGLKAFLLKARLSVLIIHTAPEVSGEDVLGCNEQLFAEVSSLRRAVGQQL